MVIVRRCSTTAIPTLHFYAKPKTATQEDVWVRGILDAMMGHRRRRERQATGADEPYEYDQERHRY